MKHSLLLFFLLTHLLVIAQIQRDPKASYAQPEFKSNEPIWHYTVYDSTNIGFPIELLPGRLTDGYNSVTYIRPPHWEPIIEGEFLYGYTTSLGTTSHIFGAMIYRINITNGERDWITVFDNRHSDRQEYVQSMEIVDDTLIVVTMRRYDSHVDDLIPFAYNKFGADSYVCTRKYHKNTGSLLDYYCWDNTDTNTVKVAPHSEGVRILEKLSDNSFIYLNNSIVSKKHIELSSISELGTLNYSRKDTLYYPKEKYPDFSKLFHQFSEAKMSVLENDTILVQYNYDYFDGIGRKLQPDLTYIQLYNKKLQPINRLNLGKFVDMYSTDIYEMWIRYATPEHIFLVVNRTNNSNVVVIDYNVNIISNVEYKLGNNEFTMIGGTGFLPYSKKSFMITQTYGPQIPFEIPQTLRYYLFENGTWIEKFSQEMGENHYLDEIKYFTETPNHDVIICADHAYYNEDIDLSCYETDMWMLIDGNKLGIKTSKKD
ncbi:MAG TPA: hypothetical protein PJ990_14415, partial [Saprospiraceae bacterium]|nr:hypothetical protein [Saprospiraceae bacterium]